MVSAETNYGRFPARAINYLDYLVEMQKNCYRLNKPTDAVQRAITKVVSSQGDEQTQNAFLWQSIKTKIIGGSVRVLELLETPEIKNLYMVGQKPEKRTADNYMEINKGRSTWDFVTKIRMMFQCIASEPDIPFCNFPYDRLEKRESVIVRFVDNLGHDFGKLPGFSDILTLIPDLISRSSVREQYLRRIEFLLGIMPLAHEGLVLNFKFYEEMTKGASPQKEKADLSNILRIVVAEAGIRGGSLDLENLIYLGRKYSVPQTDYCQKSFCIAADIAEDLKIKGNEPALHMLFYQIVKNSVKILQKRENGITDAEISIFAKKLKVRGQNLVAISLTDNGPGLDISGILAAKQRLVEKDPVELSPTDRMVKGEWSSLDLRIIDVINFIFERRVSGERQKGKTSSGIGLSMAKDIIDQHGGCVWVTNKFGGKGAKFLVILDPSDDGSLKQNVPELFDTTKIPAETLNSICDQLQQK